MATLLGITTIKRFTYRGDTTEEWGNTYHFTGAIPSSDAAWKTQVDLLIAEEVKCFASSSSVVRAYGYDSDDDHAHAVWSYDYALAGAAIPGAIVTPSGSQKFAGDQAGMFWAKLDHRNSRGKYVYLRKYFHDGYAQVTNADNLHANQKGYYETLAGKLQAGTIGALGFWRARSGEHAMLASGADPYVTTRTLHRRGKRPLASA